MASSYTTNLNLEKPGIGEQDGDWGTTLNNNFDTIDTKLAIKDEDDMTSNSASHLATQQSIKAYVDAQIATEDTISELNDTNISSLAAGQLLLYHNTNGNWTNATLTAGSNVSITNADGSVTIASTDTNTQLTEEQVEDFVGGMVSGNTETGISVTYQDADGTLDFEVSDTTVAGDSGSTGITPGDTLTIAGGTNVTTAMSGDTLTITATDTNTQLSQEQVEDYVGGMLDGTETFIAVSYDDTDGNIDFVVPVLDEDDMSTDSASHLATQQSIKAYADSVGGSPAADNIAAGDGAINLTTTAGNITIDAQGDDTDIIFKGTDGGVDTTFLTIDGSTAGTASFNHDIKLASDAAVLGFGADNDVTVTHVADTGLLLNGTSQLQFNDASQNITAPNATTLDINATDEIELNATNIDLNGSVDLNTVGAMHTYKAGQSFFQGRTAAGAYYETDARGYYTYYDANNYTRILAYSTSGGSPVWQSRSASAIKSEIESNGDFQSATDSYVAVSDERLKENIEDSGSQWNDIKAMRVRKYSFKEENLDTPNMIGVIAQELEASGMSGLVKTKPNMNPPADGNGPDEPVLDADGNPTDYKVVKTSIIHMKAVKALQEAMARIETLEAKVAALGG
tara:strand:- start:4465 stop:6342 length:1878 start_codon:yes stop_codon:yes gene_type:complete